MKQQIEKAWKEASKLMAEWTEFPEDIARHYFEFGYRKGYLDAINIVDDAEARERDYQDELSEQEQLRRGHG